MPASSAAAAKGWRALGACIQLRVAIIARPQHLQSVWQPGRRAERGVPACPAMQRAFERQRVISQHIQALEEAG